MTRMTMRKQATVSVDRQFTTEFDPPTLDETATLALGTKAEVFQFDYHHRREAIVQFRNVYVLRAETSHCVSAFTGLFGGGSRKTQCLRHMFVRMAFADAEQIDWPVLEVAGTLSRGHYESGTTVADQRTVKQMERIGNHARSEHVLDSNRFAHLCRR